MKLCCTGLKTQTVKPAAGVDREPLQAVATHRGTQPFPCACRLCREFVLQALVAFQLAQQLGRQQQAFFIEKVIGLADNLAVPP